jgi:hypothetical protein
MTRKEEIRQEAHRKYPYEGGTKGLICENSIPIFIQGAEWADKTMIEKAYEYAEARYDLDYCGNVRDILNYLKSLVEE